MSAFSPPTFVRGLECLVCHQAYPHGNLLTCPSCGIEGILDLQYDYEAAAGPLRSSIGSRAHDLWRYREILPLSPEHLFPHLQIGWTPVYDVPRLAHPLGVRKLLLKDDGRNPTNSFKDRASAIGVLKAEEFGFDTIACASTGNAASSLAGLAAAVGMKSYIFVPERTPEPKITQLLIFGATVFKVRGTYEQAFDLCREACAEFGWYNRNGGMNPFLVEGKKTAGLEIAEQCARQMPDWVVVSVGDGCTIGGIGKGLGEMKRMGFVDRVPRLLGVQAEGAKPILDAFRSGTHIVPCETHTLADSIAVGTPRNWRRAIAQILGTHGEMVAVSDEEILDAMRLTARLAAVFGEPAGIAGVAGVRKALEQNIIKSNESVLVVVTGNGLKDVQSAKRAAGTELVLTPTLEALAAALAHGGR